MKDSNLSDADWLRKMVDFTDYIIAWQRDRDRFRAEFIRDPPCTTSCPRHCNTAWAASVAGMDV